MDDKKLSGKHPSLYLWGNLLAMAVVVVLLFLGVKFGLEAYTHHGEGIAVPKVEGMTYNTARMLLEEEGLIIMVSDSGYNKKFPADYILAQTPGVGTQVKAGHMVYVTVNSPSSPTVVIPDIVDNSSLREAEARLTAIGFRLMPAQRVSGERDWVYGIVCRGRRVSNGDRITIEYPLTLLVGDGSVGELDDYEYVEPVNPSQVVGEGEMDEFVEVPEP